MAGCLGLTFQLQHRGVVKQCLGITVGRGDNCQPSLRFTGNLLKDYLLNLIRQHRRLQVLDTEGANKLNRLPYPFDHGKRRYSVQVTDGSTEPIDPDRVMGNCLKCPAGCDLPRQHLGVFRPCAKAVQCILGLLQTAVLVRTNAGEAFGQ